MDAIFKLGTVILIIGSQLFLPNIGLAAMKAVTTDSVWLKPQPAGSSPSAPANHTFQSGVGLGGHNVELAYTPPNKGGPSRGTGGSGTR
ncbi:MAG: hypothetical protein WCA35_18470 [Kovacikia sp.]